MNSRALGFGCVLALATACSSPTPPADNDTGTVNPGDDSGMDTGTGPGNDAGNDAHVPMDGGPWQSECITLTFPTITVPDGVENTQCAILDLGNTVPMHVHSLHNQLGPGSHHFIVYRASTTAVETTTPFDCTPFVDTLSADSGSPLMITQRQDELLTLPTGVGYTLPAHQLIRLELHYINITGAPATLAPTTTLCPVPDAEFTDEADFLFIGNPDVNIAPHTTATLGPTFYRLDTQFADAHFFAITGHTHQLGTNVIVQTGGTGAGPFTDVYNVSGWSWAEPDTIVADPPFQVPTGGGFNFTCEWNNTTTNTVRFGESTTDEMCFFWAYYYPAHAGAPHVCVHTDQIPGGFDLCCPGNALCSTLSSRL